MSLNATQLLEMTHIRKCSLTAARCKRVKHTANWARTHN